MMPTVQIFNPFKADMANGLHNLSSDTLKIALSNTAPSLANGVLADITQIAATGGYVPVEATVSSSTQTGGTYSLALNAVTFGGYSADTEAFRYLVLYNDTAANDELISFMDYGAEFIIASGTDFTVNAGNWLQIV